MAIFYPPPPPFMGARQPHAPAILPPAIKAVPVNDPPFTFGGPLALKYELAWLSVPDPWVYLFAGGRAPFEPRKLSPGIPGQSVDQVPYSHQARGVLASELVTLWQPDPWTYNETSRQPFEPKKLSPGVPGQSIDAPPSTLAGPLALKHELAWLSVPDPWTYLMAGGRAPFEPRKLSPGIPGQSVDRPPTQLGGPVALDAAIVAANQPDWSVKFWPYVFIGRTQPYGPRVASPRLISVAVDNPPFTDPARGPAMAAIAAAWVPPPPTFQLELYASRPTPQRLRPTARGYIIL